MSMVYGRVVEFLEGETPVVIVGDERRAAAVAPGVIGVVLGDIVEIEETAGVWTILTRWQGVQDGQFDPEGDALRWRRPGAGVSRMARLWQRQAIVRAIRGYFYDEGFLEVQAPVLVRGTCPDIGLQPIVAEGGYLTTSTEYQLARLEIGGFSKVFSLGQNIRGGEVDNLHNIEFTMCEWGRVFATLTDIERDAQRVILAAAAAVGKPDMFPTARWERISLRDALARWLGMDVTEDFSLESLQGEAQRVGLDVPIACQHDAALLLAFLEDALQPHLGVEAPIWLTDWPAFQTSSAARHSDNPAIVERSELYIGGIEIANGFPSQRDPALQRAAFAAQNEERAVRALPQIALDERYLAALTQGLPPEAAMGMGIDRLVMLVTGATTLRDVIPFLWDEL